MSGGFNVKYKDLHKISQEYKKELDSFKEAIDSCNDAIVRLINDESFAGATADAVKSYLSDVHLTILASMKVLAQNMQDQVAIYKAGYYEIDSQTGFMLDEDSINSYKSSLGTQIMQLGSNEYSVNEAIDSVSDIIYFYKPRVNSIYSSHSAINKEMNDLVQNVTDQENRTVEALEKSTEVLLDYLKRSVDALKGNTYKMASYKPNSYYQNKDVFALASLSEYFYMQHESNEEIYDAIWENEEKRAEAADQRSTEGIWKAIGGVGLVATGVACIIFTAGAATPIVVAGVAAGAGTIAFGAADAAEGGLDIYYGNTGNIDSKSFNALRDTIFDGNEDAYHFTEGIFAFTASALVPIGTAYKAGSLTFRSGSVAVGKVVISDAAGQGASTVSMDLTDNRTLSMFIGMGVSTATGIGLNAIDNHFSISERTLKRGVQYDDALKMIDEMDFDNMSVADINKLLREARSTGLETIDVMKLESEILKKSGFSNFDMDHSLKEITAFKDGKVKIKEIDENNPLYRRGYPNEGEGSYSYGRWWTDERLSIEETRNKLAVLESWGNTLTGEYEINVNSKTRCIFGRAASQFDEFTKEFRLGGGKQYYFNNIDPLWVK